MPPFIPRCLSFALILVSLSLSAQYQQVKLYPDLTGEELVEALIDDYTPRRVLINAENRDTLFARVYAENDSLRCVYTGYTIYLDPTKDPTQAAFMDGESNGINTEHTWPQAFGAGNEPAKTDMHHLFPTRVDVNGKRSNFPFGEIDDNQTEIWYFDRQRRSSKPSGNIDQWSEYKDGRFEPREDHKGNVARAMFYFNTIYRARANGAGAGYFELQRQTLCRWHLADPVDRKEWERSWRIASHQDGKANPFVLDCTLPERCYCEDLEERCDLSTSTEEPEPIQDLRIFPNPVQQNMTIAFELPARADVQLLLLDSQGRTVASILSEELAKGGHQLHWSPQDEGLPAGMYFTHLKISTDQRHWQNTRKMVFVP
ncbi:MAG: endonuclease [Bacteroidota bacterium]